MKCALNLGYQYVSMEFYHTILLFRITLSIASRKIFLFIKFSQFICRRQIGQENGFLISFFLKWKLLGIENKSTSAIKLKKKSNYQKKIFGRLVGISYTFNTNTKFLSNFPYISNIWSNFYILSVRIDCFMRTKVHFQL